MREPSSRSVLPNLSMVEVPPGVAAVHNRAVSLADRPSPDSAIARTQEVSS